MTTKLAATRHGNLIYDVGMHKGEDTEFYLKKGFRVIGLEADPDLVDDLRIKFVDAIERDALVLIEGAIVDLNVIEAGQKKTRFYKNMDRFVWGTIRSDWASRNRLLGAESRAIEIDAVNFSACIEEHGIPYYMKVDIEGADVICLQALFDFELKPNYVSIESGTVRFAQLEKDISLLEQLGYNKFMAVQQANIIGQIPPRPPREGRYVAHEFLPGSSGLFGNELLGHWKTKDEILSFYRRVFLLYTLFGDYSFLNRIKGGWIFKKTLSAIFRRPIPGWYDTHAKHSSVV